MRQPLGAIALLISSAGAAAAAQPQTVFALHGYDGAPPQGVAVDGAGNLYTETGEGGACTVNPIFGCSTLERIDPAGHDTPLVHFDGKTGYGGGGPLVVAGNRLIGVTEKGPGFNGGGTVFSVGLDGSDYRILHAFSGSDGIFPQAPLVVEPDGTIYGIAEYGITPQQGTLFRIGADGTFSVLHEFTGDAAGGEPISLVGSPDGAIFGSTANGACASMPLNIGCQAIFRYDPAAGFVTIQSYSPNLGRYPLLSAVGRDGTLYGSSHAGPKSKGDLFSLQPSPAGYVYTVLYNFSGGQAGKDPFGGPVLASDGALVGGATAQLPGEVPYSIIYAFRGGLYRVIARFSADVNGSAPASLDAPLVQAPDGTVYGTTAQGGVPNCEKNAVPASGCGTVFRLVAGRP